MIIPYENRYTLLAIDPSTDSAGFSILEIDVVTGAINIPFATTIYKSHLLRGHKWMLDVHGEKETAIYCYGKMLTDLLETWDPISVTMEAPYYNRFPSSFKALSEVSMVFINAIMDYDINIPITRIDPATVKKGMGVSGKSGDKGLMLTALQNSKLPITYTNVDINALDDNAIDSICIGLVSARNICNKIPA